jgi:A/G-specific adenine glycosylase
LANPLKYSLADSVVAWQRQHGRHDLPWQNTTDAYRVWLSEVMLQQTQVATVIDYYQRFLDKFPTVDALASASSDEVLALWSGLGYYSRARNLHRCAQEVVSRFEGQFPQKQSDLMTLPGIGRSTAAAISAFAFGQSAAILDGNVKRVFCRVFGVVGYPGKSDIDKQLWIIAEREKPNGSVESYTQGLMDLGATLCQRSKPRCDECPLNTRCVAFEKKLQAELPTRKPKQQMPTKYATFFLDMKGDAVLLERRPPTGIWGGLWCLPQLGAISNVKQAEENLPISNSKIRDDFEHSFTHFKMRAQVFERPKEINASRDSVGEPTQRWVKFSELPEFGLPTPIKAYLTDLVSILSAR